MPRTKSKPVSDEQLAANRANAARSTGPRSPEGKARSAQNARKHGFTGSTFGVVRLEELDEVAHLRDDAVAVYQPVNSQELFAVERIAIAQQGMLRASRLESGLFTTCLNETVDNRDRPLILLNEILFNNDIEVSKPQNRNYCTAEGWNTISRKSNAIGLFLRYQAQAERHYRRAIEDFDRLKSLRHELPNEPNYDPQPQPTEPTCPSSQMNPIDPETPVPAPESQPTATPSAPTQAPDPTPPGTPEHQATETPIPPVPTAGTETDSQTGVVDFPSRRPKSPPHPASRRRSRRLQ